MNETYDKTIRETPKLPEVWPGWETVEELGKGSFGAVYKVRRVTMGQEEYAAVKHISVPKDAAEIDELRRNGYDDESITAKFREQSEKLLQEYTLMRSLSGYTNIVKCDDIRTLPHVDGIGSDIFIRMGLLTALDKLEPERFAEEEIVKLGVDLCCALELCEKKKLIHRDIKPANIFVSDSGDYKLWDFGVSRLKENDLTTTLFAGTSRFMAPEVCGMKPYNCTADIYSLGLVLYWLLNERRTPFQPLPPAKLSYNGDTEAWERRMKGEAIPEPKNGSAALKRIVLKALAYDPKERYQSAAEMKRALETMHEPAPKPAPIPKPAPKNKAMWLLALLPALALALVLGGNETGETRSVPGSVAETLAPVPEPTVEPTPEPISMSNVHCTFLYNDSGITITGYEGELPADMILPEEIDGKKVTSIGISAFNNCSSLTSVTIPEGVTSIGSQAFRNCSNLTSVTIPEGVTSIGSYAFSTCSSLTSVTIPVSVTSIGDGAFYFCTDLTSVAVPLNSEVGTNAFPEHCAVTYTGSPNVVCTFVDNSGGITITGYEGELPADMILPGEIDGKRVTFIAGSAFKDCDSLTSVTIPEGVTSIGDSAFYSCDNLKGVTIPNSVTKISYSAFSFCDSLTGVTIPNSVRSIGDSAFSYCDSLTSVTIPEGVTSIGGSAFYSCDNLTSITIPASVASIDDDAFAGCRSLTDIIVSEDNDKYSARDGILFDKAQTTLVCCPGGKQSYEIPEGVTSIGSSAFSACINLTSVTIPNSVTSIGNWAFSSCYVLTSVTVPSSVTSIGDYAFFFCYDLTSATIPAKCNVGDNAFPEKCKIIRR